MVKLGKTFGNLMVDVKATNEKLQARARRIVRQATGVEAEEADAALTKADGSVKAAIVTLLTGVSVPEAYRLLHAASGSVRGALERMVR
jgi:N-acetylmuramic acid 6-phosphate etherase